jgi:hypothetical protein
MTGKPRKRTARDKSYVSPTEGWYPGGVDGEAKAGQAKVLRNFFPTTSNIRMRAGSRDFATGMPTAPVETLLTYAVGSSPKMFACLDGKIFDVSAGGTIGAAVLSGFGSNRWQSVNFTTSGGTTYLAAVNGVNPRRLYDGSTWATTPPMTPTGTADALTDIWVHQNRIFAVRGGTMDAYYLPVDSIGGVLVALPLGGFFSRGGSLLAGSTWSVDLSNTTDDLCVFVTTEGEVAVFAGTNPSSASTWELRGVYQIGKPLGVRCFLRAGGDLAIMTEDGMIPLSQVISLAPEALATQAVTRPIEPEWRAAVDQVGSTNGWEVLSWPRKGQAIVAIPTQPGEDGRQFVANITTGKWCDYVGWPATTFAVYQNRLFFGTSNGFVVEADVGGSDRNGSYTAICVLHYDTLRNASSYKIAQMARATINASVNPNALLSVHADFSLVLPSAPSVGPQIGGEAVYDDGIWNSATFPGAPRLFNNWQAVTGDGNALALAIQITSGQDQDPNATVSRFDLLYTEGTPL